MSTMRVNGAELFFEQIGAGSPLLMLHGNGLDHTYLRPWHDALSDRARVIYYDQRWNGRSEHKGPHTHASHHADAIALLDQLGIERTTIYGHSYGSWLALSLAASYPERVERLILCGTSPAFDYPDQVVANAQARNPEAAAALIGGLQNGVATDEQLRDLWHRILPLYFAGAPNPETLANVRFSAAGFTGAMQQLAGFTMVEQLPAMKMPIRVITGIADFITPPSQGRRLVDLAPNATFVEIARAGHFPFVEQRDAYLEAITATM